jgi:sigma-B regulation protein RsbU (phosphoserine phosphatase)
MENLFDSSILIVDDTPQNIDILVELLTDFDNSIAINGKDALEIAFEDLPDLILLDIMMPGMDGYEACKILKADKRTKDIPIIFLTAVTDSQSIVRGFELGAVDFVTKPFNASELLARVTTQLSLKRLRDKNLQYTHEIEKKNKMITDSINYAKRIQTAILPEHEKLKRIFKDFFVMFKPRDIVSGDFYWIRQVDQKTIIITADCTGHGVPGAFMSMFGVAFLNEIVDREKISIPSEILNRLREMIIHSLNQRKETEIKDGMDMSIITIDESNSKMEYAGANNPVYMIRNKELIVLKSDRMPVSLHIKMEDFKNHEIELYDEDQIYLFSDGIVDQFGGPQNKKFMHKKFKNILLYNAEKSMPQQKYAIKNAYENWKGNCQQLDDIMVIGIKI